MVDLKVRKPKVYVTQRPPTKRAPNGEVLPILDLSTAENFGELVYLAHRGEVEDGDEGELLWKMRDRLAAFDHHTDYILPMGHTIAMIAGAVAALEHSDDGTLRIMQWDKRLQHYEVFKLDIHVQPRQENGR